jgi:hypothetical protein
VEPTTIKVTGSSSILTASAGCQTIVGEDDWVTKSSIALDAREIDRIQKVIDEDMGRIASITKNQCDQVEIVSEGYTQETLLWQLDHTALQTHLALFRNLRTIVKHHREDAGEQREHAEKVSAAVRHLKGKVNQLKEDPDGKLKLLEKEYQNQIDVLLIKFLKYLDDMNEEAASDVGLDHLLSLMVH